MLPSAFIFQKDTADTATADVARFIALSIYSICKIDASCFLGHIFGQQNRKDGEGTILPNVELLKLVVVSCTFCMI